jgi:hypothetical protein
MMEKIIVMIIISKTNFMISRFFKTTIIPPQKERLSKLIALYE